MVFFHMGAGEAGVQFAWIWNVYYYLEAISYGLVVSMTDSTAFIINVNSCFLYKKSPSLSMEFCLYLH